MADSGDVTFGVSASATLSCAVSRAGTVDTETARSRHDDVTQLAARLLERNDLEPAALAHVIVDLGPGSYTGLRSAVTFARFAVAFGGCGASSVTSFELAVLAAIDAGAIPPPARVRVILDARRERFHTAVVEAAAEQLVVAESPRALPVDEALALVQPDEFVLADERLHARITSATRLVAATPYSATALFDPRLQPRRADIGDLQPLYLMGSYAGEG